MRRVLDQTDVDQRRIFLQTVHYIGKCKPRAASPGSQLGPELTPLAPNRPRWSPKPCPGRLCPELQLRWLFQGLSPKEVPGYHIIST